MRVDSIRFSQATVSGPTRLHGIEVTLPELVAAFRNHGYISDPIAVVGMPDGKVTSIDNRRLWAAQKAGLSHIPVILHAPDEAWGNGAQRRFLMRGTPLVDLAGELGTPGRLLLKAKQFPDTHLLAAIRRCANQRDHNGQEMFPLLGSFQLPRYTREKRFPDRSPAEERKVRGWIGDNGKTANRPNPGMGAASQLDRRRDQGTSRRGRGDLER